MSLWDYLEFISNPFQYREKHKPETGNEELLKKIYYELIILQERTQKMALNLDALSAEVARVQTVQESAITLLKALAEELDKIAADLHSCHSNTADLVALDELAAKLKASTDALAAGIAESDDVFEVPVEEPVVEEPTEPEPEMPTEPEVPAEEPVAEEPVVEPEPEVTEEPVVVEDGTFFDASGIPGMEGTQSGEAVEKTEE